MSLAHQCLWFSAEQAIVCNCGHRENNVPDAEYAGWAAREHYDEMSGVLPPTAQDAERYDLENQLATSCPECGEVGACAYDAEGRPLIHAPLPEPEQT